MNTLHLYSQFLLHYLTFHDVHPKSLSFFQNLTNHGCISGFVSELVSYHDTNKFHDEFEDEIDDILDAITENMGYDNRFQTMGSLRGAKYVGSMTQEKNFLAWLGFEETAYQLACDLFPNKF